MLLRFFTITHLLNYSRRNTIFFNISFDLTGLNIKRIMENIKSTDYGNENFADGALCDNASSGLQLRAGAQRENKESKENFLFEYRQTLFTYNGERLYSLPDQSSLQNVYFSEDNVTGTSRSQTNVRRKREIEDMITIENLRKWIPTRQSTDPKIMLCRGLDFKLMNYNVLAQDLLTEHAYLYRRHSPAALVWETRWKNLYKEITEHKADRAVYFVDQLASSDQYNRSPDELETVCQYLSIHIPSTSQYSFILISVKIICLQEVQESHLDRYYKQIDKLGYGSIFKKRTGYRTDGCAFYYRQSMFTLIDYITVEYLQPNVTLLNRENVAIIAVLAPKNNPDAKLVVATTHLLYNPKRQDIRVAQTQVLLTEIERMAFKRIGRNNKPEYYPIIVTGDFNSVPESAVLELITKGHLKYNNLQKRTLANLNLNKSSSDVNGKELIPSKLHITDNCQHVNLLERREQGSHLSREEQENLIHLHSSDREPRKEVAPRNESLFSTGHLSHHLNLKTAFKYRIGNDTEGTTFQNAWITVDYIFYSTEERSKADGRLKLMERYSVPTTSYLNAVKHIPNFVLGSDHLSLLAKFKLEY